MSIVEIYEQFPAEKDCIAHLESIRWPNGPTCPYCESQNSTPLAGEQRHHCNACNTSYSVTVNTIFHRTHLPLQKWFLALSLILNSKKRVSARQLAREIKVNRNTGWRISMQIRKAMNERSSRDLLTDISILTNSIIALTTENTMIFLHSL